MDLSRKRERMALQPRSNPYYQKRAKGAYIGFRRGADTWHARFRDRDNNQHWKPLEGIGADDFDGACRAADEWFASFQQIAVRAPKRGTVKDALEAYLA